MSARSPRASLSGASSAEVADDFGESLKDLQINNRYEISNLTVIAKENTEHAQAISKTLEMHIKSTSPSRKLPALYLLDSIVKNVGTPYTVYLGRNLYSTFMDAYTLVDATTRRSMDGMLKTWKEQVPGSMDPRPVFPPETVRPIENALIKAKTVLLQSNRSMPAPMHIQPDYRNTPTPPNYANRFAPPPPQGQPQQQQYSNYQQSTPQPPYAQAHLSTPQQHQYQYPVPNSQPVNNVWEVKRDVGALIGQRQVQFGVNPYDQRLRDELQALLDLNNYLSDKTYVDPASLQQIRDRVAGLAGSGAMAARSGPTPPPQMHNPSWQSGVPVSQSPGIFPGLQGPYPQPPPVQVTPAPHQPALPIFAPGALDGLQALLANGQKPGTPQIRAAAPDLQHASHAQLQNVQSQAAAAPAFNGADLIASLSKNGLLPNLDSQPQPAQPPLPPSSAPPSTAQSTTALLQSLQNLLPPKIPSQTGTPIMTSATLSASSPNKSKPKIHIPMTTAALKTFHPHLIDTLYRDLPNQCSTCGRRFPASELGREQKARHLDWHFRTNQRMADSAVRRGGCREWFPSEIEWVRLKEFDVSTTTAGEQAAILSGGAGANTSGSGAAGAGGETAAAEVYVKAPPGVTRSTCSICFEELKSAYAEGLQEWVFWGAQMHEGRIVHAKCLAEMTKGLPRSTGSGGGGGSLAAALAAVGGGMNASARQRSATPDSSLGKRKAEGLLVGGNMGSKVRVD